MAVAMYVILHLALKSRQQKVVTGELGLVGEVGVAETEINPEGRIFIHGEWWKAVSSSRIPPRQRVRVTGVEGLTLRVEAMNETALRQASIAHEEVRSREPKRS
jgi:membrane-bound serine protease (ClpP class)